MHLFIRITSIATCVRAVLMGLSNNTTLRSVSSPPCHTHLKNAGLGAFMPSGTMQKFLSRESLPTLRLGASGRTNIWPSMATVQGRRLFIHIWHAYCPGAPSFGHLDSSLLTIEKTHDHLFCLRLFMSVSIGRPISSPALRNLKIMVYARL